VRSLGDCADWLSGGTPFKGNPDFWRGSIPWISAKDMKSFRLYDAEDHISDSAVGNGGKVVPAGTILLLVRGMTLHNDVPISVVKRDMAFNQDIKAISPKADVDNQFLAYWLLAHKPDLLSAVDHAGHGTGRLLTDLLKKMVVSLPPLAEQKAIAAVLGALDDKIELNRRMNATLEAMARALFQSWFVDFDPVRAKLDGRQPAGLDAATAALFPAHFQDSHLGPVPHGWSVTPLSELCTLGRGASPRPINDYMNGEVPWVKIADATAAGGPFLFETKEKVKTAGAEKSVAVSPGDLILSNSATCGVPVFVDIHGCIHDGWLYFKNLRSISKLYLFHVLIELAEHLVHIADGSVQKNLNTNLVGQQNVLVPPKAIVDAYDAQATVWFAKIRQNGLESRTLAILRDTLLPKLLSAEITTTGRIQ
jgi:type I restriction enzyme S subunit